MSSNPIIRTDGLSKRFETVHAVKDVDFDDVEGEITAVVGDNGAGKSTLIEMLCGVLEPTDGDIFLSGERVEFDDYNDAQREGIGTVYQDLALAESQSVAANIFLGNEPTRAGIAGRLGLVDEREMATEASAVLERGRSPSIRTRPSGVSPAGSNRRSRSRAHCSSIRRPSSWTNRRARCR